MSLTHFLTSALICSVWDQMATTGAKEIFSTDGVIPDYRFSSIPGEGGAVAEARDAGKKKS